MYKFISLFIIIIFTIHVAHSQEDNLLVNGGFEKKGSDKILHDWKDNSGWADVVVKYSRVFSEERKGFVQKIRCEKFNNGAVQFVQEGVEIRSGDVYKISFWAKGNLDAPLAVLLRKEGKPYTTYHAKAYKVTDKWKQYSYVAPVSIDDSSAFLMFIFTSKGELLLDDVSFAPVVTLNNANKHHVGNLLANGNFEIGIDKWGVDFRGVGYENEMPVVAMELKAGTDATWSKYGKHSLKIPSVKNSRFVSTSENIVLSPGKKHSLSLWVYSEITRKLSIGIKSGYFGNTTETMKTISVGPKWKRYVISTVPKPTQENAYFVAIEGQGPGSILIDGVQLEEGDAKSFNNKTPIEIGFTKQNAHPFFMLNEAISLTVHIAAHERADNCRVKVNSIDYYGEKKTIFLDECGLEVNSNSDIVLSHPSDKTGYFRLVAEIMRNEKVIDSSEYAIGIIPETPGATLIENIISPFGGHGKFAAGELNTLSKLGIRWLRMHPPQGTKWLLVEEEKGHYRYYDKEISQATNAGFQILGSLDETPRWASSAPENEKQFWSYPPRNFDDWENYVYNIVSHYKGIIDYWEVWNEPDSGGFLKIPDVLGAEKKPGIYVELLKRAYRAAKKANPNAVIIGGCTTGKPPSRWLKSIFDLDALDYMDAVSFHYYTDGRPGDVLDSPTSVDIQEIRSLMRLKIGRTIPIWETESGIMYPKTEYTNLKEISPSYAVPGNEAVAYLIRNYIHLIASGVDKWFYYSMFTSHRIDRREATGFFEWDGAPRPLSVAYAVLSNSLSGLVYSDTYNANEAVKVTKFIGKNRDLMIVSAKLWEAVDNHAVSLNIGESYSEVTVYNAMGNKINFIRNSSVIKFDVSREPVYVELHKKSVIN